MAQTRLTQETKDTILGMKLTIARYQDSSDSDDPYLQATNRGNKLKRKVHHMQDAQSGRNPGAKAYKRTIEHAGYRRNILRRNPKRYDEDGEELEDEDEDGEADARAAEDNPYADIHLENLLLPLTSPASLLNHPSLSIPYLSSTLTDMAQHACELVQRERKTLNNAKQLLKKLRGDQTWIPCGSLCSKSDEVLFSTEHLYNGTASNGIPQGPRRVHTQERMVNGIGNGDRQLGTRSEAKPGTELANTNESHEDTTEEDSIDAIEAAAYGALHPSPPNEAQEEEVTKLNVLPDLEMTGANGKVSEGQGAKPGDSEELERCFEDDIVDIVGPEASITGPAESEDTLDTDVGSGRNSGHSGNNDHTVTRASPLTDGPIPAAADIPTNGDTALATENTGDEVMEDGIDADDETKPSPRRMRTRAQAQAANSPATTTRTASPSSSIPPPIHPLFIIPPSAIPSCDIGLPPTEAEETRRMLILYVQKQEEVCRGAKKLHQGLLKADRQRMTVFKWCKAEGHVGEMSDGEDWYDKEEWGLEEGLRKGHNDDEDEGAVQGKKTRGRRA
ncbi:hypothetical protein HO173_011906 [Letharia columbiana]|uniref:Transcriptional regulatory protein RXT2 N-terminal domain-containing protein n=1 Tax=Letharia columbiana TaxID=112416 RepID=A0A8H6CQH7_9LECA|nr:uncharacterized protein HO173_011906 [Letharia columbiana]KAF6227804.1 hypothetical protein HO173_011906 [Letharia columbiana]